jgi:FG-GAP repeat
MARAYLLLLVLLALATSPACETRRAVGGGETIGRTSSALTWQRVGAFSASDAAPGDGFGWSVGVSGTTALIGAQGANGLRGAVYAYERKGAGFAFAEKLVADDAADFDALGWSVAIAGDVAAAGAVGKNAAYVFRRTSGKWAQSKKLVPVGVVANDEAGTCVALDATGTTLVVGAPQHGGGAGAAYVFAAGANGAWSPQGSLLASDGAGTLDGFGTSCAISGDTILVGAPKRGQGAVYVFGRTGTTWTEQAPALVSTNVGPAASFGWSVAIAGMQAIVGAYDHAVGATGLAGAVYVFTKSGTTWTSTKTITAPTPATNDRFGWSVAIAAPRVVVGTRIRSKPGSVYVYDSSKAYALETTLTAASPLVGDFYGYSVAIDKDTIVSGGPRDPFLSKEGVATMDRLARSKGEACTSSDDCLSAFCTDGVCCDTACGGGAKDDCQACSIAAGAAKDGTCAPHAAGTVCRPAASTCDVVDACDGKSATCPADAVAANGVACGAGGQCIGGKCSVDELPGADGGTTPVGPDAPGDGGSGGCAVAPPGRAPGAWLVALLALAVARGLRKALKREAFFMAPRR